MTIVFRATCLEIMLSVAISQIADTEQQNHRFWGERRLQQPESPRHESSFMCFVKKIHTTKLFPLELLA